MPILFENTIIVAYYNVIKVFQCEPLHTWEVRNGLLIDTITGLELKKKMNNNNNTISDNTCIYNNTEEEEEEPEDNEIKYDYPETHKIPVETRVNLTQLCSPQDVLDFGDVEMINDTTYKIYASKYGKHNDKLIDTNITYISNGIYPSLIEATYKVKRYYAVPNYININKPYVEWRIRFNKLWIHYK
jgi:hypothetical protein